MAKVYIVNRSFHDFSAAERYGKLIFLSEGPMDRFAVNDMARQFEPFLKDSSPEDYIVPCALASMNIVACSMFATKHNKLNLLLYKNGNGYVERNLVL
jgi:hypothetical protein